MICAPISTGELCEKRKAFIWGATFSFLSSNDGAFRELSLLIKHLFIAKEDARSVALHDWAFSGGLDLDTVDGHRNETSSALASLAGQMNPQVRRTLSTQ